MKADLVPVTVRATTNVAPKPAFEAAVPVDLTKIFTGFGLLPAVVGVRDQTGSWDHVGVSRRPVLSDGTAAFEQVTRYEPVSYFAYEVSGFTNAQGRLVTGARGSWTFEPTADGGTAIEWTYAFRPRRLRRTLVRLVIAPIWRLYMRRALDATVRELWRLDAAGPGPLARPASLGGGPGRTGPRRRARNGRRGDPRAHDVPEKRQSGAPPARPLCYTPTRSYSNPDAIRQHGPIIARRGGSRPGRKDDRGPPPVGLGRPSRSGI